MSLDNNHIDFEQLKAYFSGSLTEVEKNALEQQALDDPFLQDAMDGFAQNPDYINEFDKHFQKKNPFKQKRNIAVRTMTIMGVLASIYVVALVFNPDNKLNDSEIAENLDKDSIITMEVEVLPIEIDTLIVVDNTELIPITEIVKNKIEIDDKLDRSPGLWVRQSSNPNKLKFQVSSFSD